MPLPPSPAAVPALSFHALAPTPPMGWNSWDCFGTAVTEQQTKANADYMAEHLKAFGYDYVVVDIQWYQPTALHGHDYEAGAMLTLDANGRLLPAANKFPSAADGKGFAPLADYVHSKGLKFGIHLMRGIPRQAVRQNLPVLGTTATAKDIANVNDTCPWNPDMYGVDMSRPGAQAYYDGVFKLAASWGVDFVKVDDLSRPYADHRPEIEAIRRAIDGCGRPLVLSTSPGETPLAEAAHVARHANMWRISDDFWDSWKALREQFDRCANWAKTGVTGPGRWPDADMLPMGAVRVGQKGPWTHFTHDEQYTMLSLWSLCNAPLMVGGDLPQNDRFTLDLLTNPEVLEIDRHARAGRELSRGDGKIVWLADASDGRDKYVGLFNVADRPDGSDEPGMNVVVGLADVGFRGRVRTRDVWKRQDRGPAEGTVTAKVPWHGVVLLRVSPE